MEQETGWIKNLVRALAPPVILALLLAGAFWVLNRVPDVVHGPATQQYSSIEQAELELGIDVLLPPYFPDEFDYPPREIESTTSPVMSVRLVFSSRTTGEDSLWIIQSLGTTEKDNLMPLLTTVMQKRFVPLGGRQCLLMVGTNSDGVAAYQISWSADGWSYRIGTTYALDELLRMATSMARE